MSETTDRYVRWGIMCCRLVEPDHPVWTGLSFRPGGEVRSKEAVAERAASAAAAAVSLWSPAWAAAVSADIARLARECRLPLTCERWRDSGLMPDLGDGRVLVWKHVTCSGDGNNGYPYRVGQPFACVGMACAGPYGALRDWRKYDETPHVLAIAGECYDLRPDDGVYLCLTGTPLALYAATSTGDDFDLHLREGQPALELLSDL